MKGIYINLDRCTDRKNSLLEQLDLAGLPSTEYQRFSAVEPADDDPRLLQGLKSKGELGLFLSLASVFAQIGGGQFDDVVHVLEDDVSFSPDVSNAIALVSHELHSNPQLANVDIVFLDYFINRDLFAYVSSRRASLAPGLIDLIPASSSYLACTGSFLVRRTSATYLSTILFKILNSPISLAPVDLTLRALLRMGAMSGYMTVPPVCAPGWEQDEISTIQSNGDDALRVSQRSHILLRLLASGIKSPFWCAQKLEKIHGVTSPVKPEGDANDFLSYFDSLSEKMQNF